VVILWVRFVTYRCDRNDDRNGRIIDEYSDYIKILIDENALELL